MSKPNLIEVGQLMAERLGSVDPTKFPDEEFELYSIPAYDIRKPEKVRGKEIGSTKQIVQPGDVLLSKIVPHIRRAWIVGPSSGKRIVASGEWIVFRNNSILPKYLRYVVLGNRFHAEFMSTVSGVGGSLLRARPSFVAKIKIPVPSESEQIEIAEKLERIESIQATRETTIKMIDEFLKSQFIEMFGDPVSNPKNWKTDSLRNCVEEFRYGTSVKATGGKLPVLRIPNITGDEINLSDLKSVSLKDTEAARILLKKGDVLFVRTNGNQEYIGRSNVFDLEGDYVYASYLIRARLKGGLLDPKFLTVMLNSSTMRSVVMSKTSTTAGQFNINTENLGSIEIIIPPIEKQKQFVECTEKVRLLKKKMNQSKCELLSLFHSQFAEAFERLK